MNKLILAVLLLVPSLSWGQGQTVDCRTIKTGGTPSSAPNCYTSVANFAALSTIPSQYRVAFMVVSTQNDGASYRLAADLTTWTAWPPTPSIPAPSPTTLGGVNSKAAASHQFLTQIDTDGSIGSAQPAYADVSGLNTAATHVASDFDASGSAAAVQAFSLQKSANLSDVLLPRTAHSSLLDLPVRPPFNTYTAWNALGDSFTATVCGGSVYPNCYVQLLATLTGMTANDLGVSGAMVAEVSQEAHTLVIGTGTLSTVMVGVNDKRFYTDTIKEAVYKAGIYESYAYLAVPDANKLHAQDSGVTYSSSCPTQQMWAGAAWLTSRCATVGQTITFTLYGSTLYIPYIVNGSGTANNATWNVSVDGTVVAAYTGNPGEDITSQNGLTYAAQMTPLRGFTEAAHTVVMTVLTVPDGNSYMPFDWASGNQNVVYNGGPTVIVGNVARGTAAGYTTYGGSDALVATFNGMVRSVVASLLADGLNVGFVDVGAIINPLTGIGPDGLHPNVTGYQQIRDGFYGQIYSSRIVSGVSTTQPNAQFGSFGIQAVSNVGGTYIEDNAYYNGSNFTNPSNGQSALMVANGGSWEMRTNAASNTAGTNLNVGMFTNLQVYNGLFGIGGKVTPGVCCNVTNFDLYNTAGHAIVLPNNRLSLPGTNATAVELGISNWGAQANSALGMLLMENCQYNSGFVTIVTGGCSAINQNVNEFGFVMFPSAAAGTNLGGGATAEKLKTNLDGTFASGNMSTSTGTYTGFNYKVDGTTGHIQYGGTAPTGSVCGSSFSVESHSTDASGTITVGTSSSNACTVTFANAYGTYAHCTVTNQSSVAGFAYVVTLSKITLASTGALDASVVVWHCDGI